MMTFYDTQVKPANNKLGELLGIKKISVEYTPSTWKLADDSYEFVCIHDTVLCEAIDVSMDYDPENSYTVTLITCADCGAEEITE